MILYSFIQILFYRLDKIELLKKKMSCSTENPDVFIANNYCDQNDILLSNQQSLNDDPHLREDNVSYIEYI